MTFRGPPLIATLLLTSCAPRASTSAVAATDADACQDMPSLDDDAALVGALERCAHLKLVTPLERAPLGDDGLAVWAHPREDAASQPRHALLAWVDARRHAAATVVETWDAMRPSFHGRVEVLAGNRVLVERAEPLAQQATSSRWLGGAPDLFERVWLRRGDRLVLAGTYDVRRREARPDGDDDGSSRTGEPASLFRDSRSTVRFHEDRIDVHDEVTWTWDERCPRDIAIYWRGVRQATSTYDRAWVLQGDSLVEEPHRRDDVPKTSHAIEEECH